MDDSEVRAWAWVTQPTDLGDFLRDSRVRRGLTQGELAEELGISRQYVNEIEQGKPSLYTDRLFALLRELGIVLRAEERP
ncbi:helix-turn-helix domain-containing protein [Cellulomonas sp. McL0617]|uniref:helix-turn-helix domain-containing protein n=1 Tax=Cellulomonas sp. McL0617 TaxID=3415675 RepID=UPI003CF47B3C